MDKAALNLIDCKVGKKIKERRLIKAISQTKLANAMDLTFQQIQKYENGKNRVSASRLVQIAQILDCPISYFFEEPNQKWPQAPEKGLLNWIALYNKTTPETRKVLYRIVSAITKNAPKKKGDGKEARH